MEFGVYGAFWSSLLRCQQLPDPIPVTRMDERTFAGTLPNGQKVEIHLLSEPTGTSDEELKKLFKDGVTFRIFS